jgi:hypothetical protein
MAPTTVRMVLVEGENADGVTVDEENFGVTDGEDSAIFSAPDQVVAAILGTREGANEAGYHLLSTGVTWSDQQEAAELRVVLGRGGVGPVDRQHDRLCPHRAAIHRARFCDLGSGGHHRRLDR